MKHAIQFLLSVLVLVHFSTARADIGCDKSGNRNAFELAGNPELLAEAKRCATEREAERRNEMEGICKRKSFSDQYNQECILSSMPGAKNKVAVSEALEYCASKAPCNIVKSKRSGIFGVTSANGCFEKYGKHQSLAIAAHYIQAACYDLYEDK